ncbi:hypothetical protein PtA15_16A318 [Puccinia triticina]|uniref:Uncharacterized protein n=1 Tax=Puccinia triticina TaxID=208348 RepID=A0ABY7D595_9BASI|nr:uncharacterized protein PtA15_16A318 [Puccinia triticina]WAQ92410.1 hypothetical protein PtA15_16A318 [Puccinia triticina]
MLTAPTTKGKGQSSQEQAESQRPSQENPNVTQPSGKGKTTKKSAPQTRSATKIVVAEGPAEGPSTSPRSHGQKSEQWRNRNHHSPTGRQRRKEGATVHREPGVGDRLINHHGGH